MKRLWIIDDDEIFQEIIKLMIDKTGIPCTISVFTDGHKALKEMHQLTEDTLPDVLLLDINMPMMSSWEFLDQLQKQPLQATKTPNIQIVTSSVSTADKVKAQDYKAVQGFIVKPVDMQILEQILR